MARQGGCASLIDSRDHEFCIGIDLAFFSIRAIRTRGHTFITREHDGA